MAKHPEPRNPFNLNRSRSIAGECAISRSNAEAIRKEANKHQKIIADSYDLFTPLNQCHALIMTIRNKSDYPSEKAKYKTEGLTIPQKRATHKELSRRATSLLNLLTTLDIDVVNDLALTSSLTGSKDQTAAIETIDSIIQQVSQLETAAAKCQQMPDQDYYPTTGSTKRDLGIDTATNFLLNTYHQSSNRLPSTGSEENTSPAERFLFASLKLMGFRVTKEVCRKLIKANISQKKQK